MSKGRRNLTVQTNKIFLTFITMIIGTVGLEEFAPKVTFITFANTTRYERKTASQIYCREQ